MADRSERAESPELVASTRPVTVRVYITLYPDSMAMPALDDPKAWDCDRTALFVCGPGRVVRRCGGLGDFSEQMPVTVPQLARLMDLLDMTMPDEAGVPCAARVESLTVNLAGCAACAMRACVKLAPGTLVLLCDHLLCCERHAHRRAAVRLKWWRPRAVVVAPRNLLEPRYSLDRDDVLAVARCWHNSYRGAALSFANYPIRLFDVPRSRLGVGDAYFFVQWCVGELLPRRTPGRRQKRSDESTRTPAERSLALLQMVAARKEAWRLTLALRQPEDVQLGRGVHVPPVRRHGTACHACTSRPSYLNLCSVLELWLDTDPPLTWRYGPRSMHGH
jgi:hypothetical protein